MEITDQSPAHDIPRGSVLRPSLFVKFVNNLPFDLVSGVKLFTNDAKVYGKISDGVGHDNLQGDLGELDQQFSN